MKKNIILSLLVVCFVLIGCTNEKTVTIEGASYKLIRPAHTNDDGTVDISLYQKVGEENKYYTPSLDQKGMYPISK
jgi:uncharacterized lipoprotein NlpE involved in copper resistance